MSVLVLIITRIFSKHLLISLFLTIDILLTEASTMLRTAVSNVTFSFPVWVSLGPTPPRRSGHAFPCPQCGRKYRHRANLGRHMKVECGKEARFHCVACPYKTKHKHDLARHQMSRRHTPEEFIFV